VGAALPRSAAVAGWNDIFQSYGLMAMRTEQHGNRFAKLNNGNLSDGFDAGERLPAKPTRSLAGWAASMPILQPAELLKRRLRG
jgi:hypothetical protein